ncbi:MAG: glycerophosphodiester phosphodiesterase family protein [Novosphingobium sp.]
MRLSLFTPLDRRLAPAPDPERVRWIGGQAYAHRGLHGPGVPENSPAAFAAAIERGMGIELDVQRSADGQAMVFHDYGLDRLTGETGPLDERTAAQLGAIRLTGGVDTIPALRQVLDQIGGRVPLLIEVKSHRNMRALSVCLAVLRVLEGYRGPHGVMSFDPRVPRWFKRYASLSVRGLVVTEENDHTIFGRMRRRLSLWQASPDFLAYDIRDLPSRFASAQRKRGLPVVAWTVRSPELLERARLHADAPIAEGAGAV